MQKYIVCLFVPLKYQNLGSKIVVFILKYNPLRLTLNLSDNAAKGVLCYPLLLIFSHK